MTDADYLFNLIPCGPPITTCRPVSYDNAIRKHKWTITMNNDVEIWEVRKTTGKNKYVATTHLLPPDTT